MTYIDLINEFWRQNSFKPFGGLDTTVYMYLLHQCNIRKWINPFELQTRNLELALGFTRKMIQESRMRLKQRGLIDFTEGNRAKTPTYTIIGLPQSGVSHRNVSTNVSTNVSANESTNESANVSANESETQVETLIKTKSKDLKEKPPKGGKKKTLSPAEMIEDFRRNSENECYLRFLAWLEETAPYVARNISPLSQTEFEKLKAEFGSNAIMLNIQNLENRKDLRGKYASLYRTLINWCKNGYNDSL